MFVSLTLRYKSFPYFPGEDGRILAFVLFNLAHHSRCGHFGLGPADHCRWMLVRWRDLVVRLGLRVVRGHQTGCGQQRRVRRRGRGEVGERGRRSWWLWWLRAHSVEQRGHGWMRHRRRRGQRRGSGGRQASWTDCGCLVGVVVAWKGIEWSLSLAVEQMRFRLANE